MELEIKVALHDRAALEQRLQELGAQPGKERHQRDTYYSPKHVRYYDGGFYCRLREKLDVGTAEFSYHVTRLLGEHSEYGSEELDAPIGDSETLQEILRRLEFRIECVIDKRRSPWQYNEFEIVIDAVQGLGLFAEVELLAEGTKENFQRVLDLAAQLGFEEKDHLPLQGYPDLWRERHGETTDGKAS